MVRTPCCKSEGLKRGAWTPEEDEKLTAYIQEHGEGGWRTLPERADLKRCGKSCRLRWANYLRPDIKRGQFSSEDEEIIIKLHSIKGNKWSTIARRLPGRTDNEIKNYWNTHIKKRLMQKGIDPISHKPINSGSDKEEETGTTHCPGSISGSDSGSTPGTTNSPSSISGSDSGSASGSATGSYSGSVQLLNRVATKFSLNANRLFLAELIQGAGKKNSNDSLTTEISMQDSDSVGTIGSGKYCTGTPSDDFQGVSTETIGSWESLRTFEDQDLFDSTNDDNVIRVMQDLKSVFSDDQFNTVGIDCEEPVSEEIGSYWNDDLDLGDFGLLESSLFLPII